MSVLWDRLMLFFPLPEEWLMWKPDSVAAPQSQNIMSDFQNCETVLQF